MKLTDEFKMDILEGRINADNSPIGDIRNEGGMDANGMATGPFVGRLRYDGMRLESVDGAGRLVLRWQGKDTAVFTSPVGGTFDIPGEGKCPLVVTE